MVTPIISKIVVASGGKLNDLAFNENKKKESAVK